MCRRFGRLLGELGQRVALRAGRQRQRGRRAPRAPRPRRPRERQRGRRRRHAAQRAQGGRVTSLRRRPRPALTAPACVAERLGVVAAAAARAVHVLHQVMRPRRPPRPQPAPPPAPAPSSAPAPRALCPCFVLHASVSSLERALFHIKIEARRSRIVPPRRTNGEAYLSYIYIQIIVVINSPLTSGILFDSNT